MKIIQITAKLAEKFYTIHKKRFFSKLVEDITAGKLIVLVLENDNSNVVKNGKKNN